MVERKEFIINGYKIKFCVNPFFGGLSYSEYKHELLVVSDKRMTKEQIEEYLCREMPGFREASAIERLPENQYAPEYIIKDIQQHAEAERKAGARQKVIGRSGIMIDGDSDTSKVWISNREYQMTTTVQKNILGTIVGTQSHGIVDILDSDGVVTSKNTRMGRLLSENALGHHVCKTPKGVISFEIFNRAFFQSTIDQVKNIRLNWEGKSRLFPDSKTAITTLEAESKGLGSTVSSQHQIIREQATLRLNPFLDKLQNDIKFSHVLDNSCLVIDGGPGTGKTTTLIQRLKLLINEYDLKDYQLNYEECSLTDKQIAIATNPQKNWIFFSPNNLMRKYLRANMVYEGLSDVDRKTVVWSDYLQQIVRSYYFFAFLPGSTFNYDDNFFLEIDNLKALGLVKSFSAFYWRNICQIFESAADVDASKFCKLKLRVIALKKICTEAKKCNSVTTAMSFVSQLQEYSEQHRESLGMTIKEVQEEYDNLLKLLTNYFVMEFKSNSIIWSCLIELAVSWLNEEDNHASSYSNINIEKALTTELKLLITRIAKHEFGETLLLNLHAQQLYKIVGKQIVHEKLKELGEYIVYRNYVRLIAQSPESILFDKIVAWYKTYRSMLFREEAFDFFPEKALFHLVKNNNNKSITGTEIALLVGFCNNIARELLQYNPTKFEASQHVFITAYKYCSIPVIGIDEATDYSMMDYYAIASLRDYRVSSVTLCGDLMQCMRFDGIKDWRILQDSLIFDSLEIKQLTLSYRQSPELMKLADHLYEITVGRPSPYTCNIEDYGNSPKPLWFDNTDEQERTNWIADRILDIRKAYSALPSIAVFAKDKMAAKRLESILLSNRSLKQSGIDIVDCCNKEYILEQSNKVRIFEIDKVKGMEFDAVFFFDIDTAEVDTDSINRFLYVGLSRAAFFIAVTTSGVKSQTTEVLKSCFDTEDNWNPSKTDQITVGIDFGHYSTKVCIEASNKKKTLHKLFEFEGEENRYCLPTEVHLCSNWTLQYGSVAPATDSVNVISSMKCFEEEISANDATWNNLLPRSYVAIWYLAYIIFSIKEQYDSKLQIQLGIKADYKNFDERKKKATSLLLSALRLVDDVFEGDFGQFITTTVQELQVKTIILPYNETQKIDKGVYVLPDSYASLFMLSKWVKFDRGIHLHANIGHTTSQLTFFELHNDTPYIYNSISLPIGKYKMNGQTEIQTEPYHIFQTLLHATERGRLRLKQLAEQGKITFRSGVFSKKALRRSVSFWGGGAIGPFWITYDRHRELSNFPGLLSKTDDLGNCHLLNSAVLSSNIQLYTSAIGLSYHVEGDNIPLAGFDLFEIQFKQPEPGQQSKPQSTPSSKKKHISQISREVNTYVDQGGISHDLGYRSIISAYPTPRIQKMTPEGYDHGLY